MRATLISTKLSATEMMEYVKSGTFNTSRNPVAGSRPVFRDILLPLLDKPESVLSIPPEALDTHHLAGVLGSPLEAGENMYRDLRYTYL